MRSRKLAALQAALKPPRIHGDPEGDLLAVGWGSALEDDLAVVGLGCQVSTAVLAGRPEVLRLRVAVAARSSIPRASRFRRPGQGWGIHRRLKGLLRPLTA